MNSSAYAETFDEIHEQPKDRRGNGQARHPRFRFKRFEDIKPSKKLSYLIKGLLPREGLAVIWGAPKSGKSFIAYDLAMHIALGRAYRGHRVRQGSVAYLALEGGGGFVNRVEAWRQHRLGDHAGPVPFRLLDVPLDLIAEHRDLIAAIREQFEDAPAAVFIDTLNRALVGDENSPADMAKLIRAADALHLAFGCLVVLIHHCGVAGSRPRGHTSLAGANDVQISVAKNDDGLVTVTVEHMKDGWPESPLACRLERVETGLDDEGSASTSCIVVPVDAAPASASIRASKLTGSQARFLDILADALLDAPTEHKTASGIPNGRLAISREWLKTCCKSKGWFEREQQPRQGQQHDQRARRQAPGQRQPALRVGCPMIAQACAARTPCAAKATRRLLTEPHPSAIGVLEDEPPRSPPRCRPGPQPHRLSAPCYRSHGQRCHQSEAWRPHRQHRARPGLWDLPRHRLRLRARHQRVRPRRHHHDRPAWLGQKQARQ
jgi:hypothetical protein